MIAVGRAILRSISWFLPYAVEKYGMLYRTRYLLTSNSTFLPNSHWLPKNKSKVLSVLLNFVSYPGTTIKVDEISASCLFRDAVGYPGSICGPWPRTEPRLIRQGQEKGVRTFPRTCRSLSVSQVLVEIAASDLLLKNLLDPGLAF